VDIGFWELCLIALVALIVFGPEQLPDIAHKAGKMIRKAKTLWNGMTEEIRESMTDQPHEK